MALRLINAPTEFEVVGPMSAGAAVQLLQVQDLDPTAGEDHAPDGAYS